MLTKQEVEQIEQQAIEELKQQEQRVEIDRHKEKLRRRKSFWLRIFPWRFNIYRADQPLVNREVLAMAAKLKTEGYYVYSHDSNIFLTVGGAIWHHVLYKKG